jgi:hypothetical protein
MPVHDVRAKGTGDAHATPDVAAASATRTQAERHAPRRSRAGSDCRRCSSRRSHRFPPRQASCFGRGHRRPSERCAGLGRTPRPAANPSAGRPAALPSPTPGRLSRPRGAAVMEAAWKHQKERDDSSAGAPDPRVACASAGSATDGSGRKQAGAHGMHEVVGSNPTSSTARITCKWPSFHQPRGSFVQRLE